MDEIESDTQSFIVKVWVEDHAEEAGHRVWRGHITHVSSNKRRYLNKPERDRRFHLRLIWKKWAYSLGYVGKSNAGSTL